jgi:hypothetical protein
LNNDGPTFAKCAGFAQFSLWYYLNRIYGGQNNRGLICLYEKEIAESVILRANDLANNHESVAWEDIWDKVAIAFKPDATTITHLVKKISEGRPQVLKAGKVIIDDLKPAVAWHNILIYGYKKTSNSQYEFYFYDSNFPTRQILIAEKNLFGLYQFVPYRGYDNFWPNYLGDTLSSQFQNILDDVVRYPQTAVCDDDDYDGVINESDVCNDTPLNSNVNEKGCAFGKVPDTGQTNSYTNTFGEDSDYTINPPSYTKLDANGNDLADSTPSWAMVRDNVTGLIWENKTNDGSIHDRDNRYTWYDPNAATNGGYAGTPGNGTDTKDFIDALNTARFGGFDDWRLPTVKELSWLVNSNISYPGPTINTTNFQNTMSSSYWSSTTNAYYTSSAWYVSFRYGYVDYGDYLKSYSLYVRAVRGGQ